MGLVEDSMAKESFRYAKSLRAAESHPEQATELPTKGVLPATGRSIDDIDAEE